MTQKNSMTSSPVHSGSLAKRMLQGAGIALIVISAFLLSAGEPNPEWSKLYMVKPLILTPLVASLGGVLYYFLENLSSQGGWRKTLAIILSLVGYIIVLWMGTVLGLNGTYWN